MPGCLNFHCAYNYTFRFLIHPFSMFPFDLRENIRKASDVFKGYQTQILGENGLSNPGSI